MDGHGEDGEGMYPEGQHRQWSSVPALLAVLGPWMHSFPHHTRKLPIPDPFTPHFLFSKVRLLTALLKGLVLAGAGAFMDTASLARGEWGTHGWPTGTWVGMERGRPLRMVGEEGVKRGDTDSPPLRFPRQGA